MYKLGCNSEFFEMFWKWKAQFRCRTLKYHWLWCSPLHYFPCRRNSSVLEMVAMHRFNIGKHRGTVQSESSKVESWSSKIQSYSKRCVCCNKPHLSGRVSQRSSNPKKPLLCPQHYCLKILKAFAEWIVKLQRASDREEEEMPWWFPWQICLPVEAASAACMQQLG